MRRIECVADLIEVLSEFAPDAPVAVGIKQLRPLAAVIIEASMIDGRVWLALSARDVGGTPLAPSKAWDPNGDFA